jgi:uncharacterized SAM-binding protein YcdF (DUF218 family)
MPEPYHSPRALMFAWLLLIAALIAIACFVPAP